MRNKEAGRVQNLALAVFRHTREEALGRGREGENGGGGGRVGGGPRPDREKTVPPRQIDLSARLGCSEMGRGQGDMRPCG